MRFLGEALTPPWLCDPVNIRDAWPRDQVIYGDWVWELQGTGQWHRIGRGWMIS